MMQATAHLYIVTDSQILSGEPIIKGTRDADGLSHGINELHMDSPCFPLAGRDRLVRFSRPGVHHHSSG